MAKKEVPQIIKEAKKTVETISSELSSPNIQFLTAKQKLALTLIEMWEKHGVEPTFRKQTKKKK